MTILHKVHTVVTTRAMIKKVLRSLEVGKPLVQIIWGTVVDFSQWVPHSMNTYISDQFPAYPLEKKLSLPQLSQWSG